jgi:dipeptidyl aminopeptidase/acylaminoacyl peptidase
VADQPEIKRYFTQVRPVEFETTNGKTAFGLFYPPHNPDYQPPEGEQPPLLVKVHGGPTGSASSTLDLRIQYWTSRGIAVLDVNYGGSTGFGREYRERLRGEWGVVDVDDCINGARSLARDGVADGNRAVITGGSAGGYTALAALAFRDFFKGGGSHYGVSDLEALDLDTHKFESRYNQWLIGDYPAQKQLYQERSPVHFADRVKCPIIFFQGDEDRVVPPNQTEGMVNALRRSGVPVGYLLFAGEQHGFRKSENIKRALDAELYFYSELVFRIGLSF